MTLRVRLAGEILVALGLLALALGCAYLWLFHGWAASGPPSPRPEWHRGWSVRFFWGMLASLAATVGWIIWRVLRQRSRPAG